MSRGSILFADDDLMVLGATAAALRLSGFEVTTVVSASQALAAMEARLPDALLVDIDMPGNQNLEFVRWLNNEHPALPVVILTGYPTLDTAVGAVRLGVVDYITKPPNIEELLERLDLALHRGRVLQSIAQAERLADELSRRLDTLKQVVGQGPGARLVGEPHLSSAALDPLRNLDPDELLRLSPREREVLGELAKGHSPQDIAETLTLSTHTIRNHLKAIFLKLGVNSQVALLGKLAMPQH